jgi:hypothetical protein
LRASRRYRMEWGGCFPGPVTWRWSCPAVPSFWRGRPWQSARVACPASHVACSRVSRLGVSGHVAFPAETPEATFFCFGFASSPGPAGYRRRDGEAERRSAPEICRLSLPFPVSLRPCVTPSLCPVSWVLPPVVATLASRSLGRVVCRYGVVKEAWARDCPRALRATPPPNTSSTPFATWPAGGS